MGQSWITKTEQLRDYGDGTQTGSVEFGHIDLPDRITVTVFIHRQYGGPVKAEVNWSALGSVDAQTAKQYSEVMAAAAEFTATFNKSWT